MLWFWRNNTGKFHGNLLQELSQDFSECLKSGRGTNLSRDVYFEVYLWLGNNIPI